MAKKSSPERSCVGCNAKKAKNELVRFRLGSGYLEADSRVLKNRYASGEGRGAYLCYNKECLLKALKKNAFTRALKGPVRFAGFDQVGLDEKQLLEAAGEHLWQTVFCSLLKTGKNKKVK